VAETIKELRSLPDEEVIRRHDGKAVHTVVGTKHSLKEGASL
jgi:F420-0:gamma-glutamyl ligase-like protein